MAYRDKYEIRQGRIQLYRRTAEGGKHQSDAWYCALRIPGQKTIRRSLKTTIQDEAERKAENIWFDLNQRNERGLSLSTKRFDLVANRFLTDLENKVEQDSKLEPLMQQFKPSLYKGKRIDIHKFLIPYFDGKNLHDITDQDILNFEHWRRNYWISGAGSTQTHVEFTRNGRTVRRSKLANEQKEPNWNTINKELTTLRQIFEFARKSSIIEGREIPVIKNVKKPRYTKTKKPGLTEPDVKHLLETLVTRYKHQANPKHQRSHKLLLHYISWMCLTGMRVAEAKNLKISDCRKFTKEDKSYLKVFVHGKGKSRELVALDEAITVLDKLVYFHKTNAALHGWIYSDDLHIFSDQYGKAVGSFANGLNRAFEDAGLLYDVYGDKRSGGAFRKYYITHALIVGNINYFELAKQTGNSIQVIEEYYAEIDPTQRPEMFIFKNALTGVYDDNPANKF
ncbi:MAG: site-specific integrase [Oceanospirillales bacterium]|nr:site-specific integrase [Oceanospirillales bacterium]MBR9887173.1 site-specific integrase [Oceanospirillales bacterium]